MIDVAIDLLKLKDRIERTLQSEFELYCFDCEKYLSSVKEAFEKHSTHYVVTKKDLEVIYEFLKWFLKNL